MPRSADGRWAAECRRCGKEFDQRKPDQEFCSQKCSNKAFPGTGGRKAASGLEPRTCPVCKNQFQPYRANQVACTPKHYKQMPETRKRNNAARRNEEFKARKNKWRRARYSPTRERKYQLATKYGITPEQYEIKLEAQGGVCILCGSPPKPDGVKASSKLHQDHDHETGQNRDLPCLHCNRGLGYFKDDPVLLRAAADYIERHKMMAEVT